MKHFLKKLLGKHKQHWMFKSTKPRETFSFKPTISFKWFWMIGLLGLEVYSSIFNATEKNIKFEFYTDTFEGFSFADLKVGL